MECGAAYDLEMQEMQEAISYWNIVERSEARELEMQRRMQEPIDCWNVVERGAANVPGEMHGACDSVSWELHFPVMCWPAFHDIPAINYLLNFLHFKVI